MTIVIAISKNQLKSIFILPIVLAIILVPLSTLIGWNLITLLLFWFVLIPCLAIYLPAIILKSKNHLSEALIGIIIFYAARVFMIYGHYDTDYFKIMILSDGINLVLVTGMSLIKRSKTIFNIK